MKFIELRKKSARELKTMLGEFLVKRDDLAFLLRQKKVKNVYELRSVRRDIARIQTMLRQLQEPEV